MSPAVRRAAVSRTGMSRSAEARTAGSRGVVALARSAALVPVLAALLLAGCTSGGPAPAGPGAAPPDPRAVVEGAARALAGAGSARVEITADTVAGPVTASGPMRFEPFATELTATVGPRRAQVRAVDGRAWLRLGARWQPLSPGLLPLGAVAGALRAAPGLAGVTGQGPEQLGAVPAVRYTGTVDLAAAKAADPAAAARIDELAALVSPAPRITAWVGTAGADRGRLVRLRLEPPTGPGGPQVASAPVPGAVTVGFADPGTPVAVRPPG